MGPPLKITRIVFAAGPRGASESLEIDASSVVILVGPNNSGKSQALRDIFDLTQQQELEHVVVNSIDTKLPTQSAELVRLLRELEVPPPKESSNQREIWFSTFQLGGGPGVRSGSHRIDDLERAHMKGDHVYLERLFLPLFTIRLDGRTRFELCNDQEAGDLQASPQNHLASLFRDRTSRIAVRKLVHDAFGWYFVIDPTNLGRFRIRLSRRPPLDDMEEQALDNRARDFHANARPLNTFSDGVQAFSGLVSAVMSLPHRVMLIDEPDAFLHPPLARRLGAALTELAIKRNATLVCATHSSNFLVGCVTQAPQVTVVRLTFDDEQASSRALSASEIEQLVTDPLLRSTKALEALFHKGAVITEGDTDRAFYEELNRRLEVVGRGISDSVFLNAQNWQTTPKIAKPLRELGVPAAIVIDLDAVLSDPWSSLYSAAFIPPAVVDQLEPRRAECAGLLRALPTLNGQKAYKVQGISALSGSDRSILKRHLDRLASYGVFVVPVGEVEKWLPSLGVSTTKRGWLVRMFSRLGSANQPTTYVQPGSDDAWAYLDRIGKWVANPMRGMPKP